MTGTRIEQQSFRNAAELETLLRRFEDASLPRPEWNHRAHVAVAGWYVLGESEGDAAARFIGAIKRYNGAHGIAATARGGYHQTLTLFWLAQVRAALARQPADGATLQRINRLVEQLGHRKRLFEDYYSPDLLWSAAARQSWVEPDLRPLGGVG